MRVSQEDVARQHTRPYNQSGDLSAHDEAVALAFDQRCGVFIGCCGKEVLDRFVEHAMLLQPVSRAAMTLLQEVGRGGAQALAEYFGEELMVAIPRAGGIERRHEE